MAPPPTNNEKGQSPPGKKDDITKQTENDQKTTPAQKKNNEKLQRHGMHWHKHHQFGIPSHAVTKDDKISQHPKGMKFKYLRPDYYQWIK